MSTDRYYVVVQGADPVDGGYCVFVPALPEIATQGDDEAEALENAADAIRKALRFWRERRTDIPISDTAEISVGHGESSEEHADSQDPDALDCLSDEMSEIGDVSS